MKTRILKYILGLFIVTLGISVAIKSNLGSPPVSAVPYTLTVLTNLEMGYGTIIFQSFLVLLQIIILRKDFELKNLLQVLVSVVFGKMTTFSNYLMTFLPDIENLPIRIGMILISCFLIALGIALYVPANIVPMPSEGFIKTIADKSKKAFSDIKVGFDCTAVGLSGILCLIFTKTLGSVGIGTVILAILVGIINKRILKLFAKISTRKKERTDD